MKSVAKPRLLVLTSSFPGSRSDQVAGYIREFAESLSDCFNIKVLAPDDYEYDDSAYRSFRVVRSLFPRRWNKFRAGADLNEVIHTGFLARLALFPGLLAFALRAMTLSIKADAICSHWMAPSGVIGALSGRLLGKPHIVIEHSGSLHFLRRRSIGRLVARFVVRNSKAVVVVSENLRRKLIEVCPEAEAKSKVIPMGVRIDEPPCDRSGAPLRAPRSGRHYVPAEDSGNTDRRPRTLLFIGRLVQIKGADVFIRAVASLDNVHAIIAGDGAERANLERLAASLGADVEFTGSVGGVIKARLYERADAVVIPSVVMDDGREEGTPVVCLEAMAASRPVIASRSGGLSDLIADGQNGLFFDPGDHEELASKLNALLDDSDLSHRLSVAGRLTGARYDWAVIGPAFCSVIRG